MKSPKKAVTSRKPALDLTREGMLQ